MVKMFQKIILITVTCFLISVDASGDIIGNVCADTLLATELKIEMFLKYGNNVYQLCSEMKNKAYLKKKNIYLMKTSGKMKIAYQESL